ncbi:hypothetical protein K3G63_17760 [Hymenobacter sp. HSC-4F20]|uniref:hypothetical protein n=1 Tax=Hymenobacter sp. HSC-4F20 TaxID=2864135 RepID=UPI001C7396FF|nr:hypothetical protein [Hymenobacter sp. HSC-4F20]MBX0292299.1 hypothetical protein [Hymenobacter sp. HSC-4F20]
MRYSSAVFLLLCFLSRSNAIAQITPNSAKDSARVIALPDVQIAGISQQLVVASGTEDNKHAHIVGPGGGNAIRFLAAQAGYHQLRQVRLHVRHASELPANKIHVRVASVTDAGSPADDNLLPASVLLLPADLRAARRTITLQWPMDAVPVPERGFFIVVEGLGETTDEYVSGMLDEQKHAYYKISRRSQPGTVVRTIDAFKLPRLKGTKPDSTKIDSWHRDTLTQEWRQDRAGKSVLLVEAIFE